MSETKRKHKERIGRKPRKYKGGLIMSTTRYYRDILSMGCCGAMGDFGSSEWKVDLRPQSESLKTLKESGEADDHQSKQ